MSEERKLLTPEEAIAMLPDKEEIHTFLNPAGMLIGADIGKERVIERIQKADAIEIGGEQCRAMGHALVIKEGSRYMFIETAEAVE